MDLTPSQTVGPYLSLGLRWAAGPYVVPEGTPGAFWVRGRVLDADGVPVTDALVETWQADRDGAYGTAGFRGFGRSETVPGEWAVHTVRPGTGHVLVSVFARGLLDRVVTRIYLPGCTDPLLASLPPELAATLVAEPYEDGYRHDIHLSGPHETVFLDVAPGT